MMKPRIFTQILVCLALLSILSAACGPPATLTTTITEQDFQKESFLCQDHGLQVDFLPGKMVCSGNLEGNQTVIEIVPIVDAGKVYFQILRITVQGEVRPLEDFTELNAKLVDETYTAEEGYTITSIIITDDELTFTSTLK